MSDNIDDKLREAINKEIPLRDGAAIEIMAGKRIRDIYFEQSNDGAIKRLMLVATDYQAFAFTVNIDNVEMISALALHDSFVKLFGEKNMATVYSSVIDKKEKERVKTLFHTLWSKAVDDKEYVKSEWTELGSILEKAGM